MWSWTRPTTSRSSAILAGRRRPCSPRRSTYADIELPVTEHVEFISHLLKDAAETEELVMQEASKSKEQALASALVDLSDTAKGATKKASWLENFPAVGNFDDLAKHYNETLAKQDAKDLISKRDALHEAALQ